MGTTLAKIRLSNGLLLTAGLRDMGVAIVIVLLRWIFGTRLRGALRVFVIYFFRAGTRETTALKKYVFPLPTLRSGANVTEALKFLEILTPLRRLGRKDIAALSVRLKGLVRVIEGVRAVVPASVLNALSFRTC